MIQFNISQKSFIFFLENDILKSPSNKMLAYDEW